MRKALLALAAWAAIAGCAAAEPVDVRDGRFEADVSAKEMSRISLAGEKVASIRKIDEPAGPKMMIETDPSTGDAYVAFDGDVGGRSFSAFITTQSGKTVEAVLSPRNIEAQNVVVRLGALGAPAQGGEGQGEGQADGQAPPPVDGRTDRREGYSEIVTALVRLMFNEGAAPGVDRRVVNDRVRRAGAFEMQTLETYTVGDLRGTVLQLHNMTEVGQALNGKSFLVPGVMAAAVSHENVEPGQFARVFIVEATAQ